LKNGQRFNSELLKGSERRKGRGGWLSLSRPQFGVRRFVKREGTIECGNVTKQKEIMKVGKETGNNRHWIVSIYGHRSWEGTAGGKSALHQKGYKVL